MNNSGLPQFHLRRFGSKTVRRDVAKIMEVHYIIGRCKVEADYVIDSNNHIQSVSVSRCHARIVRQAENQHRLFDDSRNGVFVNNIKIEGSCVLQEGDKVTFGHPAGEKIKPGTWQRQPNSHHQFLFERCTCKNTEEEIKHEMVKYCFFSSPVHEVLKKQELKTPSGSGRRGDEISKMPKQSVSVENKATSEEIEDLSKDSRGAISKSVNHTVKIEERTFDIQDTSNAPNSGALPQTDPHSCTSSTDSCSYSYEKFGRKASNILKDLKELKNMLSNPSPKGSLSSTPIRGVNTNRELFKVPCKNAAAQTYQLKNEFISPCKNTAIQTENNHFQVQGATSDDKDAADLTNIQSPEIDVSERTTGMITSIVDEEAKVNPDHKHENAEYTAVKGRCTNDVQMEVELEHIVGGYKAASKEEAKVNPRHKHENVDELSTIEHSINAHPEKKVVKENIDEMDTDRTIQKRSDETTYETCSPDTRICKNSTQDNESLNKTEVGQITTAVQGTGIANISESETSSSFVQTDEILVSDTQQAARDNNRTQHEHLNEQDITHTAVKGTCTNDVQMEVELENIEGGYKAASKEEAKINPGHKDENVDELGTIEHSINAHPEKEVFKENIDEMDTARTIQNRSDVTSYETCSQDTRICKNSTQDNESLSKTEVGQITTAVQGTGIANISESETCSSCVQTDEILVSDKHQAARDNNRTQHESLDEQDITHTAVKGTCTNDVQMEVELENIVGGYKAASKEEARVHPGHKHENVDELGTIEHSINAHSEKEVVKENIDEMDSDRTIQNRYDESTYETCSPDTTICKNSTQDNESLSKTEVGQITSAVQGTDIANISESVTCSSCVQTDEILVSDKHLAARDNNRTQHENLDEQDITHTAVKGTCTNDVQMEVELENIVGGYKAAFKEEARVSPGHKHENVNELGTIEHSINAHPEKEVVKENIDEMDTDRTIQNRSDETTYETCSPDTRLCKDSTQDNESLSKTEVGQITSAVQGTDIANISESETCSSCVQTDEILVSDKQHQAARDNNRTQHENLDEQDITHTAVKGTCTNDVQMEVELENIEGGYKAASKEEAKVNPGHRHENVDELGTIEHSINAHPEKEVVKENIDEMDTDRTIQNRSDETTYETCSPDTAICKNSTQDNESLSKTEVGQITTAVQGTDIANISESETCSSCVQTDEILVSDKHQAARDNNRTQHDNLDEQDITCTAVKGTCTNDVQMEVELENIVGGYKAASNDEVDNDTTVRDYTYKLHERKGEPGTETQGNDQLAVIQVEAVEFETDKKDEDVQNEVGSSKLQQDDEVNPFELEADKDSVQAVGELESAYAQKNVSKTGSCQDDSMEHDTGCFHSDVEMYGDSEPFDVQLEDYNMENDMKDNWTSDNAELKLKRSNSLEFVLKEMDVDNDDKDKDCIENENIEEGTDVDFPGLIHAATEAKECHVLEETYMDLSDGASAAGADMVEILTVADREYGTKNLSLNEEFSKSELHESIEDIAVTREGVTDTINTDRKGCLKRKLSNSSIEDGFFASKKVFVNDADKYKIVEVPSKEVQDKPRSAMVAFKSIVSNFFKIKNKKRKSFKLNSKFTKSTQSLVYLGDKEGNYRKFVLNVPEPVNQMQVGDEDIEIIYNRKNQHNAKLQNTFESGFQMQDCLEDKCKSFDSEEEIDNNSNNYNHFEHNVQESHKGRLSHEAHSRKHYIKDNIDEKLGEARRECVMNTKPLKNKYDNGIENTELISAKVELIELTSEHRKLGTDIAQGHDNGGLNTDLTCEIVKLELETGNYDNCEHTAELTCDYVKLNLDTDTREVPLVSDDDEDIITTSFQSVCRFSNKQGVSEDPVIISDDSSCDEECENEVERYDKLNEIKCDQGKSAMYFRTNTELKYVNGSEVECDNRQNEGEFDDVQIEGECDNEQKEIECDNKQNEGECDDVQIEGECDNEQKEMECDNEENEGECDNEQDEEECETEEIERKCENEPSGTVIEGDTELNDVNEAEKECENEESEQKCDKEQNYVECDNEHHEGECDDGPNEEDCGNAHNNVECDNEQNEMDCDNVENEQKCDNAQNEEECDTVHNKVECDKQKTGMEFEEDTKLNDVDGAEEERGNDHSEDKCNREVTVKWDDKQMDLDSCDNQTEVKGDNQNVTVTECDEQSLYVSTCADNKAVSTECDDQSSECGDKQAYVFKCGDQQVAVTECDEQSLYVSTCADNKAVSTECVDQSSDLSECGNKQAYVFKFCDQQVAVTECDDQSVYELECDNHQADVTECGDQPADVIECGDHHLANVTKCGPHQQAIVTESGDNQQANVTESGDQPTAETECDYKIAYVTTFVDQQANLLECGDQQAGETECGDQTSDVTECGDKPTYVADCSDQSANVIDCGNQPEGVTECGDQTADDTECGNHPANVTKSGNHPAIVIECGDKPSVVTEFGDQSADVMECGDVTECDYQPSYVTECDYQPSYVTECDDQPTVVTEVGDQTADAMECGDKSANETVCDNQPANVMECGDQKVDETEYSDQPADATKGDGDPANVTEYGDQPPNLMECGDQLANKTKCGDQLTAETECGDRPTHVTEYGNQTASVNVMECVDQKADETENSDQPADKTDCDDQPADVTECCDLQTNETECGDQPAAKTVCVNQPTAQTECGDQPTAQTECDNSTDIAECSDQPSAQTECGDQPTAQTECGDQPTAQTECDNPRDITECGDQPTAQTECGDQPTAQTECDNPTDIAECGDQAADVTADKTECDTQAADVTADETECDDKLEVVTHCGYQHEADVTECDDQQGDFTECDDPQADVTECDNQHADVIECDDQPADVTECDGQPTDVTECDDQPADITECDDQPADITECDDQPADITECDDQPVDVTDCDDQPADVTECSDQDDLAESDDVGEVMETSVYNSDIETSVCNTNINRRSSAGEEDTHSNISCSTPKDILIPCSQMYPALKYIESDDEAKSPVWPEADNDNEDMTRVVASDQLSCDFSDYTSFSDLDIPMSDDDSENESSVLNQNTVDFNLRGTVEPNTSCDIMEYGIPGDNVDAEKDSEPTIEDEDDDDDIFLFNIDDSGIGNAENNLEMNDWNAPDKNVMVKLETGEDSEVNLKRKHDETNDSSKSKRIRKRFSSYKLSMEADTLTDDDDDSHHLENFDNQTEVNVDDHQATVTECSDQLTDRTECVDEQTTAVFKTPELVMTSFQSKGSISPARLSLEDGLSCTQLISSPDVDLIPASQVNCVTEKLELKVLNQGLGTEKQNRAKELIEKLKARKAVKKERESQIEDSMPSTSRQESISESSSENQGRMENTLEVNIDSHINRCESVICKMKTLFEHNSTLPKVQAWRAQLCTIEKKLNFPKTVIAVVGKTGDGKSSLLNALLDEKNVLPTSCIQACTAAVVEVVKNTSGDKYEADIEFLERKEWFNEVKVLLKDLTGSDGKLRNRQPDPASEAYASYWKIRGVYGKIDKYVNLIRQNTVTRWLGKTKVLESFQPEDFKKQVEKYIETQDSGTGDQFWPIVKCVKLRIPNCDVCSSGAALVDLPGVRDSNAARDKIAKEYMQNCTDIWVVSSIHRAVDDKTAKELLGENFRRQLLMDGQYGSVTFICTKTDIIEPSEVIRKLRLKDTIKGYTDALSKADADKKLKEFRVTRCNEETGDLRQKLDGYETDAKDMKDSLDELGSIQDPSELEMEDSQGFVALKECQEDLKLKEEEIEQTKIRLIDLDMEQQEASKKVLELDNDVVNYRKKISEKCATARNTFSVKRIQSDYKAGLKEMKRRAGLLDDDYEEIYDSDDDDNLGSTADNLRVFCCSATEYQKIQNLLDGSPQVFTSVEDTQIPALRRYVHLVTSVRRKQHLERLMRSLDRFVFGIKSYITESNHKDADRWRSTRSSIEVEVDNLYSILKPVIHQLSVDLDKVFDDNVKPKLEEGAAAAAKEANEICARWVAKNSKAAPKSKNSESIPYATYKAVVTRQGAYSSQTFGYINFNEDLSEPMYRKMTIVWDRTFSGVLFEVLANAQKRLHEKLKEFLDNLGKTLYKLGLGKERLLRVGIQYLGSASNRLEDMVDQLKACITMRQREISRVVTPHIQDSLSEPYGQASREFGPGTFLRMKDHMSKGIDRGRLKMFDEATEKLMTELVDLQKDVIQYTEEVCQSLIQDLRVTLEPFWNSSGQASPFNETILPVLTDVCHYVGEILAMAGLETTQDPTVDRPSCSTSADDGTHHTGDETPALDHATQVTTTIYTRATPASIQQSSEVDEPQMRNSCGGHTHLLNFRDEDTNVLHSTAPQSRLSTLQQPCELQSSVQQPLVLQSSVQQPHVLKSSVQQSHVLKTKVQQPLVRQSSVQQSHVLTSTVHQPHMLQSKVEQPLVLQSSVQQLRALQSSVHQPYVLKSKVYPPYVLKSKVQQPLVPQSSVQQRWSLHSSDGITNKLQYRSNATNTENDGGEQLNAPCYTHSLLQAHTVTKMIELFSRSEASGDKGKAKESIKLETPENQDVLPNQVPAVKIEAMTAPLYSHVIPTPESKRAVTLQDHGERKIDRMTLYMPDKTDVSLKDSSYLNLNDRPLKRLLSTSQTNIVRTLVQPVVQVKQEPIDPDSNKRARRTRIKDLGFIDLTEDD